MKEQVCLNNKFTTNCKGIIQILILLAARYEIRYTTDFNKIKDESNWNDLSQIKQANLVSGSLTPVVAGSLIELQTDKTVFQERDQIFYIAIRAFDDRNLVADVSNIVSFGTLVPPGKVEDLAVQVSKDGSNVQVSFTAPGDDGKVGTGK